MQYCPYIFLYYIKSHYEGWGRGRETRGRGMEQSKEFTIGPHGILMKVLSLRPQYLYFVYSILHLKKANIVV
jgi:hypothetical protein